MADRAANASAKVARPDGRRTGLAVLFVYLPDEQVWCPVPSSDPPDPAEDELVLALDATFVAALWSDSGPGRRPKKKLFPHLVRKGRPTGLPADAVALRFAGDGARGREFEAALRSLVLSASERGWRPDDPVLPPLEAGTPREAVAIFQADDTLFFQPADEHGIAVGWVSVSPAARRRAGEYQRRLVHGGDWDELREFLGTDPLPVPDPGPGVVESGEVADRSDPSARQGSDFQQLLRAVGTGAPADRERAAERLAKVSVQAEDIPSVVEAAAAVDQPDRVRVLLLRAAGAAIDAALGGPEAVRQTVVTKGLVILYQSEGEVRQQAARLLLGLSEWDPRLRAALGELALAVPDPAGSLDQLTVAATRSREARATLRARAEAGLDLSEHTLVNQLRTLADETGGGTRDQMKEVFARLEGLSFGSIEANREVAALVRAVLDRFQESLRCTQCGERARLIVFGSNATETGLFRFDHGRSGEKRFHSAGSRIPLLEVYDTSSDAK